MGTNPAYHFYRTEGAIAGWITDEWKQTQRDLLTQASYLRLIDNQWTSAASQFLASEDWDALVQDGTVMNPEPNGHQLYVAVDASGSQRRGSDTTAAVAVRRDRDYIDLVAHRIWKPQGRNLEVDPIEFVLPWIQSLRDMGHRIRSVGFDPYNMASAAAAGRRLGLRMQGIPQGHHQSDFTKALVDVVRYRGMRIFHAPDLREHVLNAIIHESTNGKLRLAKATDSRKIDCATSLAMAVWKATLGHGGTSTIPMHLPP